MKKKIKVDSQQVIIPVDCPTTIPTTIPVIILASDPNTPPEALAILARDISYDVRFAVLKNPSTPQLIKLALLEDPVMREKR